MKSRTLMLWFLLSTSKEVATRYAYSVHKAGSGPNKAFQQGEYKPSKTDLKRRKNRKHEH